MNSLKSANTYQFSQVPSAEIPRSVFNRSHGYKTAFNSGYLVPFYVDEVLPGDSFDLNATILARLTTPIVPFMDNLYLETFFFFVPNRLLWEDWEHFNGAQDNPGDSTDFEVPSLPFNHVVETATAVDVKNFGVGSLQDYFGIPTNVGNNTIISKDVFNRLPKINVLPFRAYNLIWNEWFRDENLQSAVPVPKGSASSDSWSNYKLLRRGKRHDYFTSCLPWPQKGPAVEVPLGSWAPVCMEWHQNSDGRDWSRRVAVHTYNSDITRFETTPYIYGIDNDMTSDRFVSNSIDEEYYSKFANGMVGALNADLSSAAAVTINTLREAFQLQKLYERDARGGTRYIEILKSHFGVTSPDGRLQRPEYLGGKTERVSINTVVQTSSTDSVTPQGNLAAYGQVATSRHGFNKSFVEHGYIIGLVNVRADLTYQQGLSRLWTRKGRFDFYWPALSHLGEQAVLNSEIYCKYQTDSSKPQPDDVFGYQERWSEYRYFPSQITGKLRSDFHPSATGNLDFWHLAQKFTQCPVLNSDFIQDNPPISRVLAVQNEPEFIMDSLIELKCARPMPVYSVPGLIDHF